MSRRTPLTRECVYALADARLRLLAVMTNDADGLTDADAEALLLLEHAQAIAERSDHARRMAQSYMDHGDVNPQLQREEREIERDFAHLTAA